MFGPGMYKEKHATVRSPCILQNTGGYGSMPYNERGSQLVAHNPQLTRNLSQIYRWTFLW